MINKNLLKEAKTIGYYLPTLVAISIATGFLAVFQAKTLSMAVDKVFLKHHSLKDVGTWMALLLIVISARSVLVFFGEFLLKTGSAKIKHRLRMKIRDKIFTDGPIRLKNDKAGRICNLMLEGIESLDAYYSEYIPQVVTAAIVPITILVFVFQQDLISALIMLVTAPLIPLFMVLIGKWAKKVTQKRWDAMQSMGGHLLDILRGLTTLKLFNASKKQTGVIWRISENFRKCTMEVLRVSFLSALTLELAASISTALIAVTLGVRLINDQMHFYNAFFVLLLAPEYYMPLRQLGAKFHAGMNGNAAARDIYAFLEEKNVPVSRDESSGKTLDKEPVLLGEIETVEFRNVTFRYEPGKPVVLKNLSFIIEKGKCTALAGKSGAGKSTAASLVVGFIEAEEGVIAVNGIDKRDIDPHIWRRSIALLNQSPYFFNGTIEENLRLAKPEAAFEEILQASKLAGAHDFVLKLPKEYKTPLGENGLGLSGGQKQLLAIARAYLKNAPVLILDEPTAGLDAESMDKTGKAVKELAKGRAVLLISHDRNLLALADRVLEVGEVGVG